MMHSSPARSSAVLGNECQTSAFTHGSIFSALIMRLWGFVCLRSTLLFIRFRIKVELQKTVVRRWNCIPIVHPLLDGKEGYAWVPNCLTWIPFKRRSGSRSRLYVAGHPALPLSLSSRMVL